MIDLDRPYRLHPQVALRDEDFGALAYHYGNRRLTFLKSAELTELVRALAHQPTLRAALVATGVSERRWPSLAKALTSLEAGDMITARRGGQPDPDPC